jgi:hypothetical protein
MVEKGLHIRGELIEEGATARSGKGWMVVDTIVSQLFLIETGPPGGGIENHAGGLFRVKKVAGGWPWHGMVITESEVLDGVWGFYFRAS